MHAEKGFIRTTHAVGPGGRWDSFKHGRSTFREWLAFAVVQKEVLRGEGRGNGGLEEVGGRKRVLERGVPAGLPAKKEKERESKKNEPRG